MADPPPHTLETNVNVDFDRAARLGGHPAGLVEQIRACNTVDPHRCEPEHLERVTRRYVHELVKKNLIGPGIDVPAPDRRGKPQAASELRLLSAIERATGKPFAAADARSYLELGIFP